jgi:hypothetical protein
MIEHMSAGNSRRALNERGIMEPRSEFGYSQLFNGGFPNARQILKI